MQVIQHNSYFDGAVQSLALQTPKGKATVGVMKPGQYTFSTSSAEEMVIVTGVLEVSFDGGSTFNNYVANMQFDVAANSSFDVRCTDDVAYICYYE